MTPKRFARAERLAPYFEVQLILALRMAELTGQSVGAMAFRYTNLYRRLGFEAVTSSGPSGRWLAYAAQLETEPDLARQVELTVSAFAGADDEVQPLPGQAGFGCFAHEPPAADGGVKIHFYNLDTDAAGGPLASAKQAQRRAELAAMVRHIVEAHPEATHINGRSWLYNLEAYRRLFPPAYVDSRAPAPTPPRLTGTSLWGQLIDSREAIRPDARDTLVASPMEMDPDAPWRVFPMQALSVTGSIAVFLAHDGQA